MAINTYSYNIKPVFFGITFMVVVFLCLLFTSTNHSVRTWQLAMSDSIKDTTSSLAIIALQIFFILFTFSVFAKIVTKIYFTIFTLSKYFICVIATRFTLVFMSVFGRFAFIEISKWFNLFAFRAGFCYDCFRHIRFSNKRLCLGPCAAHTAIGSFYFNKLLKIYNIIM